MSNGDEVTRKSHIKRIYKDNDTDGDQWVDIERLDELRFVSKLRFPWREKRWTFDWPGFDPEGEHVTKKKLKQNKDDPDSDGTEVPARDMVFVTESTKQYYQGHKHYFVNNDSNSSRESHTRRVYNHDISKDKLDYNGSPPRDPENYLNVLGDQDKDQFIDVELLDKYWTNEIEGRDAHGKIKRGAWQEKKWLLNTADVDRLLKDPLFESDEVNLEGFQNVRNGVGDRTIIDPPWRIDPLQNIVNVNWGDAGAVIFGPHAEDAPEQDQGKTGR